MRNLASFENAFATTSRKSDLKKLEIVSAAIDLLYGSGPEALTFEALGEKCKLSRGQVKYYYPDKDQIYLDAISLIANLAQEATLNCLEKANTTEEKVLAIAEGAYLWLEKYPKQGAILLNFYASATSKTKFLKLHEKIRQTGQERLSKTIKSGLKLAQKKASEQAELIQNMITGSMVAAISLKYSAQKRKQNLENLKLAILNILS